MVELECAEYALRLAGMDDQKLDEKCDRAECGAITALRKDKYIL